VVKSSTYYAYDEALINFKSIPHICAICKIENKQIEYLGFNRQEGNSGYIALIKRVIASMI
jgi:hypothetical protein